MGLKLSTYQPYPVQNKLRALSSRRVAHLPQRGPPTTKRRSRHWEPPRGARARSMGSGWDVAVKRETISESQPRRKWDGGLEGMRRLAPPDLVAQSAPQGQTRSEPQSGGPAVEHIGIDRHKTQRQICVLIGGGELTEKRNQEDRRRFAEVLGPHPKVSSSPRCVDGGGMGGAVPGRIGA
jgi:hypothetical protein